MRDTNHTILWATGPNEICTSSYTYTLNTAYAAPTTTYVVGADYCAKWFGEEKHEDPKEWEQLLEENEK